MDSEVHVITLTECSQSITVGIESTSFSFPKQKAEYFNANVVIQSLTKPVIPRHKAKSLGL